MCVHACMDGPPTLTPIHPHLEVSNHSNGIILGEMAHNLILFADLQSMETPCPRGGCMSWWLDEGLGSCQITKNGINLDIMEMIQFYVKIFDMWRLLPMGGWVGICQITKNGINLDIMGEDSILCEDLWYVKTSNLGGWVGLCQITKNGKNLDLIEIIDSVWRFMIYGDFSYLWVDA